ncbi:hypothetical protein NL676_024911 [Syzygium grande]|nr:hypothetical protein NL676_024911 [Syzygium grande]
MCCVGEERDSVLRNKLRPGSEIGGQRYRDWQDSAGSVLKRWVGGQDSGIRFRGMVEKHGYREGFRGDEDGCEGDRVRFDSEAIRDWGYLFDR